MRESYSCPRCHRTSWIDDWNTATEEDFGIGIDPITPELGPTDYADYTCPMCGHTSFGKDLMKGGQLKPSTLFQIGWMQHSFEL